MSRLDQLKKELRALGNPARAEVSKYYFKTGPGQYGAGDVFIGVSVPAQRAVAKRYQDLGLANIRQLLKSGVHEHRFTALLILVRQFAKGDDKLRQALARFYIKNKSGINSWDLVDTSAEYILGPVFFKKPLGLLDRLANSKNVWDRRIAIMTTFHFIRNGEYAPTLRLVERLIGDRHDLIHKASGWMLREIGNRSLPTELKFLNKYYKKLPRTSLRYAIEKLSPAQKRFYLDK